MLLYTPIPLEMVLQNEAGEKAFQVQEMEYDGVLMQVQPVEHNQYKIIRILSTNPQHYLRVDLQPGNLI